MISQYVLLYFRYSCNRFDEKDSQNAREAQNVSKYIISLNVVMTEL